MYSIQIKANFKPRNLPGKAGKESDDAVHARSGVTWTRGRADTSPPGQRNRDTIFTHFKFQPNMD